MKATRLLIAASWLLAAANAHAAAGSMVQVTSFGSNPAGLRMWKYVPPTMPANAPLVLALHACSQQASDYVKAGWNELADQYQFYVVYPEQTTINNSLTCFNWAGSNSNPLTGENDPANLTRGQGENLSITQMVDKMKADHGIDASRVFITGLSAGGAETALMMATWPDVFAAGAPVAGVPYHCTTNKNQVYSPCLTPGNNLTPKQWGDYVRAAYTGYSGPYPRVSIWQGSKDSLVNPDNTVEMLKQWTDTHGISQTPSVSDMLAGNPHAAYKDSSGVTVVETVQITGMDHGVAIDPKHGCGTAAPYILDEGVCSSFYIGQFFGIINGAPAGDGGVTIPPQDAGVTAPIYDGSVLIPAYDGGLHYVPSDAGTHLPSPAPCSGCSAAPGAPGTAEELVAFALLATFVLLTRRMRQR